MLNLTMASCDISELQRGKPWSLSLDIAGSGNRCCDEVDTDCFHLPSNRPYSFSVSPGWLFLRKPPWYLLGPFGLDRTDPWSGLIPSLLTWQDVGDHCCLYLEGIGLNYTKERKEKPRKGKKCTVDKIFSAPFSNCSCTGIFSSIRQEIPSSTLPPLTWYMFELGFCNLQ